MKYLILKIAASQFDAVGASGKYLILGLITSPERDIDEFIFENGEYRFIGYEKYFSKKVENILAFLRRRGIKAEQVIIPETNIKHLAVKAGIGKWGKNSLVIHPKYGPWLRFVVIATDRNFKNHQKQLARFFKCTLCKDECLKACPLGILKPFRIDANDKDKCLAYLPDGGTNKKRCDLCLAACPVKR